MSRGAVSTVTRRSGALLGVGAALATIVLGPALTASSAPAAVQADAGCVIVQVQNKAPVKTSTVVRVELPGGRTTPLGERGYHLNAIGYASGQDLVYGMADHYRGRPFWGGAHVVTIDRDGRMADLGPLRHTGAHPPPHALPTAVAGTIVGNQWYVRKGVELYTVDVDPHSPAYLGVARVTRLRPASLAGLVGDVDVDPADGLLYGVTNAHDGSGEVVSIDPGTGAVRVVPGTRLPPSSTFGAVVVGPDRALYVTANLTGGHSRLYRVERGGAGSVTRISSGPALVSSDAAGCLTTPAAPPEPEPPTSVPPSPPPPASPPPSAPPPSGPPSTAPPDGAPPVGTTPVTPPPVPVPPPSSPGPVPSSPVPTSSSPVPTTSSPPAARTLSRPESEEIVEVAAGENRTEVKRRWALALLVVLLGAGAAAGRLRRGR
ncbi:DUF6923 family protein [Goodfellowiella coeruleoviolacea]|uniref:DUF6923 family protein n=1 Tax=Goodfellowiella coeruleoviolacea TaxID=334858 RepID=UPI0020A469C0|nr:hypothetical protein [Goodfellowiella coeruleoviolacea]